MFGRDVCAKAGPHFIARRGRIVIAIPGKDHQWRVGLIGLCLQKREAENWLINLFILCTTELGITWRRIYGVAISDE